MIPIEAGRLIGRDLYVVGEALPRRDECLNDLILPADRRNIGSVKVDVARIRRHHAIAGALLVLLSLGFSAIFMPAILSLALAGAVAGRLLLK